MKAKMKGGPAQGLLTDYARKSSKFRLVPISQMQVPPALVTQREFRKAFGDKLAKNLDLDKLGTPVINYRDGVAWVLDGQHRVYALKANGFDTDKDQILCEVYDNLSDAEAAEIFLGRDDRIALTLFDKFHVGCTAGRARDLGILRAVEAQRLKISRDKSEGCISAIAALGRVYDMAGGGHEGERLLGETLRTIRDAFASDPVAFDAHVIRGIAMVYHRYRGKLSERELTSRLASTAHGVRGLLRRAMSQQERTGNQKAACVAQVVVDIYNKSAGKSEKLASWVQVTQAA